MADYDILIQGGTVIDGTGVPRFRADVGIKDGRIAKLDGVRKDATADRVIDATGRHVVPGYIDIHTHYDGQILWDPYCTIGGWHGVTSVVLGNCGFGFAPIPPELRDRAMLSMTRNEAIPFDTLKEGMKWDEHGWVTLPDWMKLLKSVPKGVNAMQLVPLNPLYAWAMGGWDEAKSRRPTQNELDEMARLMNEAMDLGAVGFSYQRCGPVSTQPDFDGSPMITDLLTDAEILFFGKVLGERGEGFIEMFDARPTDHATIEEFMTALAEISGRPIARNILMGNVEFPDQHKRFLKWLEESHAKGLRPYGMAFTVRAPTFITFEDWSLWDGAPTWNKVMNGKYEDRVALMQDPEIREQLQKEIDTRRVPGPGACGYPEHLIVHGTGGVERFEPLIGRTLSDISEEWGCTITDVLLDMSIEGEFKVEFKGDCMDIEPEVVGEILNSPYAVAGISDGGAHCHFIVQGAYPTDLLEWAVREEGLISYEQAHYQLSRLPAHISGLHDRGVLREGAQADVVVYDPETISRAPRWDKAERTYDWPANGWRWTQKANGLDYTIVNGEVTFEGTDCTGAVPGRFLEIGEG
jgi:N-acyl-D-aspartate/D-glutamate deacylase